MVCHVIYKLIRDVFLIIEEHSFLLNGTWNRLQLYIKDQM